MSPSTSTRAKTYSSGLFSAVRISFLFGRGQAVLLPFSFGEPEPSANGVNVQTSSSIPGITSDDKRRSSGENWRPSVQRSLHVKQGLGATTGNGARELGAGGQAGPERWGDRGTWRKETPAEAGAIPLPESNPHNEERGLGKCQGHAAETGLPSDPPPRVLRSSWHPGHKTPILTRESALISSCTRYPSFSCPACPACGGEPAPESTYIRNAPTMQGSLTGRQRQRSPTAIAGGIRGRQGQRQGQRDGYRGDSDLRQGQRTSRP